MKRKYADRANWQRVKQKTYTQIAMHSEDFDGTISLVSIHAVHEPAYVGTHRGKLCVVDDGYKWLQHFPANAAYTLTTMFDANGQIVQWYIDICDATGVDERGIPWYDDMYLDIVVLPSGEVELIDIDELEEALQQGAVTEKQYEQAWKVAEHLLQELKEGSFHLLKQSHAHLQKLLMNMPAGD